MMIVLGSRPAAILAVLGLAFHSFSSVVAAPSAGLAQVFRSCTKPKVAALTFDDGPYLYTTEAMKTLEDHGAKGTFFVNGNNWGCIYDRAKILQDVKRRGHQIAEHTWSHPHLPSLSTSQIQQELNKTHAAIQKITGASVAFMRPPYGEYNDAVRAAAGALGETVITWDLDSGDSVGKSIQDQKQEYVNAVSEKRNNILSLQHDVHDTSIRQVLPFAIQTLQKAGYKLVTVAECLGMSPYQHEGPAQSPNSDWHC